MNAFQEAFDSAIDWGSILPDESATTQVPVSTATQDSGGFWGFTDNLTEFAGNIADVYARFENQGTGQPNSQPQAQNPYVQQQAQAGIGVTDLSKWAIFGGVALLGVYLVKEIAS